MFELKLCFYPNVTVWQDLPFNCSNKETTGKPYLGNSLAVGAQRVSHAIGLHPRTGKTEVFIVHRVGG